MPSQDRAATMQAAQRSDEKPGDEKSATATLGSSPSTGAPFGGFKQSGVGREMGVAGLEEFLERKTFAIPAVAAAGST